MRYAREVLSDGAARQGGVVTVYMSSVELGTGRILVLSEGGTIVQDVRESRREMMEDQSDVERCSRKEGGSEDRGHGLRDWCLTTCVRTTATQR